VKIAVIPPTSLLESYGVLGDKYHLCLSHEVLTNVGYAEFYQRRRREGDFVILDNSAHEQLEGQSLDQLVRAAKYVGPSEIVLPDRLFFGDDTIERSTEAFERLREEFPTTRLMGVPQGRTVKEWLVCLDAFLDLGVDTIGISKDYEVWPDGLEHSSNLSVEPANKTSICSAGDENFGSSVSSRISFEGLTRPSQLSTHCMVWSCPMSFLQRLLRSIRGDKTTSSPVPPTASIPLSFTASPEPISLPSVERPKVVSTLDEAYELAKSLGHRPTVVPSYPNEVSYDAWCPQCDALAREALPGYFQGSLLTWPCFQRRS